MHYLHTATGACEVKSKYSRRELHSMSQKLRIHEDCFDFAWMLVGSCDALQAGSSTVGVKNVFAMGATFKLHTQRKSLRWH